MLMFMTIFVGVGFLNAQYNKYNVRFVHFSLKEGLSQSAVTCIVQDNQGFLWFGTQDGLNRFDGYTFKVFKNNPDNPNSLSHNYVRDMIKDREGNLWIGTDAGGLNKYDPGTGLFRHYHHDPNDPTSLSHPCVNSLFEDRSGNLWVGTYRNGLNRLDPQTGIFTRYIHKAGNSNTISSNVVYAICEDPSGHLWIGTIDGLDRLNPKTGVFKQYMQEFIFFLLPDRQHPGIIWIGTDAKGLYSLDTATGSFIHYPFDPQNTGRNINSSRINAIFQDRTGNLWLGTEGGGLTVFNWQEKTASYFTYDPQNPHSLNSNTILSIYQDKGDILWMGTRGNGINKLDLKTTAFYNYSFTAGNPNSLSNNIIYSLYENRDRILWIGTESGLNRFDANTGSFKHYKHDPKDPSSISHDLVVTIIEDALAPGTLWMGTLKGLNRFDTKTEKFRHYFHEPANRNSLTNNLVSCLYSDPKGILWIGVSQAGIDRFDTQTETFTNLCHEPGNPNSLCDNNIFFIHRHRSGIFWIGTANGLNKLDPDSHSFKVYFKTTEKKALGRICSLCEDESGILWVGTLGGGLIRFDPFEETFKYYGLKEGLLNNVVYGLLMDDSGHLWISTNDGIFKMNTVTQQFLQYSESDGLPSKEFNVGAYHKGHSGRFYFGGINGFTAFYPSRVKTNIHIPPVVFTRYLEFNREKQLNPLISEINQLKISYEQDVFSLEFAALDFSTPERNQYKYKMDGFNKEWLLADSTQRIATYTNLDAGEYTFMVKGSNNHGLWNESPAQLKIIITPPWWGTIWFKLLMILLILGLIYFIYRLRTGAIQNQKKHLEQMVNERTEALKLANEKAKQALKAAEDASHSKSDFLARMSHEIRTPMNSIIGFTDMLLETRLDEEQYDYVRTINRSGEVLLLLINDILDFSKVESGMLTLESITFDLEEIAYDACKMIHPRIGSNPVELLCSIGDKVPLHVKGDPGRFHQVLVNLLGNAVKFTEVGEVVLSIEVEKEDDSTVTLHTMVKDTGIGIPKDKLDTIFEVFQQADGSVTRQFGGSGLGLAICKQISKLMGGDIWVESEVKKGSTFHFIAMMKKTGKDHKDEITSAMLIDKKILVVDDNQHNLDILTHTLKRAGIRVKGLSQPQEVVSVLQEAFDSHDPFHLCILDIQMPQKSGYEVAKQIRSLPLPISSIPLLAFSSSTAARSKLYQDFGFDAFLTKPARMKELLAMMERVLQEDRDKTEKKEKGVITPIQSSPGDIEPAWVLLAEDNPINRKLAGFILKRAGYQVEMAENGQEAVEKYISEAEKFTLILMDVQMPVMDGVEAVKIIRHKGFTSIPIIAMTAQSMKGDREKFLAAGMNDYISKPIRKESFLKLLKKWK